MNEMRKLMEAVKKINEDYYDSSLDTRKITNKLHELMDEQMLDPRAVADAALTYMSEADVADMTHSNELISDEDGFEESMEEEIKSGLPGGRPFIDLSGPGGNAFAIMGQAKSYAKQLGLDGDAIIDEMQQGDYENLLSVFDNYFGDYVDLYRGEDEETDGNPYGDDRHNERGL